MSLHDDISHAFKPFQVTAGILKQRVLDVEVCERVKFWCDGFYFTVQMLGRKEADGSLRLEIKTSEGQISVQPNVANSITISVSPLC